MTQKEANLGSGREDPSTSASLKKGRVSKNLSLPSSFLCSFLLLLSSSPIEKNFYSIQNNMSTFEKGDMQASGAGPVSSAEGAPVLNSSEDKTKTETQEAAAANTSDSTSDEISQNAAGSQVDVERAQAQFEALGKELSRQSSA